MEDDVRRRRIDSDASWWVTRLPECEEGERRAFLGWFRKDPDHCRAVLELSWIDQVLRSLPREDWDRAERQAEAARAAPTVMPYIPTSSARLGWIVAGLVGFVFTIQLALYLAVPDLSTAAGERRVIDLADGSTVHLNANSRIRVRLSDQAREVELQEGEALFSVAHDANRPFDVEVGNTHVRAIGTKFNILRAPDDTRVSVLEGRVRIQHVEPLHRRWLNRISDKHSQPLEIELDANREAHVTERDGSVRFIVTEMPPRTSASREKGTAGRLVFQGTRLDAAVAEINRYSRTQIRLDPSAPRHVKIGGSFRVTDVESFVEVIARMYDLKVTWLDQPQGKVVVLSAATTEDAAEKAPEASGKSGGKGQ